MALAGRSLEVISQYPIRVNINHLLFSIDRALWMLPNRGHLLLNRQSFMALKQHATCREWSIRASILESSIISQQVSYEALLVKVHHGHVLWRIWMVSGRCRATISILWRFGDYVVLLVVKIKSSIVVTPRLLNRHGSVCHFLSAPHAISNPALSRKSRWFSWIRGWCSIFFAGSFTLILMVIGFSSWSSSPALLILNSSVRSSTSNNINIFRLVLHFYWTHTINCMGSPISHIIAFKVCIC